jgi:hypothetical protein
MLSSAWLYVSITSGVKSVSWLSIQSGHSDFCSFFQPLLYWHGRASHKTFEPLSCAAMRRATGSVGVGLELT